MVVEGVTMIPCRRSRVMNGLISGVNTTVSPKHSALPSGPTLSKEKACGMVRKERDRLPKMTGRMLLRTEDAVHTPLMICG